jgi:hypothetical protein
MHSNQDSTKSFVLYAFSESRQEEHMAGPTFIVVPFEAAGGTSLHPASPVRRRMEASARAVADQVALVYAGVAVIEQPPDEFAEPRLIKAIGRVPETMLKSLAA